MSIRVVDPVYQCTVHHRMFGHVSMAGDEDIVSSLLVVAFIFLTCMQTCERDLCFNGETS